MNTVFQSMALQLMAVDNTTKHQCPTLDQYENFLKEYTFDKLKGISLGIAFTKHFKINSYYLKTVKNEVEVDKHIRLYFLEK